MRMERQPRFGELLPNRRSRELRLHGVINVELHDDAHITLWIRGTPDIRARRAAPPSAPAPKPA